MMTVLGSALLPIFAMIGLGIFAGRRGLLDNRNVAPLNTLLMTVALPASMFAAIVATRREILVLQAPFLLELAVSLLGLWVAVYVVWHWIFNRSHADAAVAAISVALPNFAAAGLPLMIAIDGSLGHVQASLAIAVGAVVLSPLTLIVLELATADQTKGRRLLPTIGRAGLRVAQAPLILLPCLAAGLVLTGVSTPPVILSTARLIGAAAGGLALVLTGLILSAYRPAFTKPVFLGVGLITVGHPILTKLMASALLQQSESLSAAVLLTALPAGFFGIFFALRFESDVHEASSIVFLSTLVSIGTLSVAILLYRHN